MIHIMKQNVFMISTLPICTSYLIWIFLKTLQCLSDE